eukprot:gb/GEZN01009503.1/.p1 GENE.gb/GEZN01009503.1/~~gb/GEZN01009503.1/.p1  ORF type:complete len:304 (+),score=23.43 gb/GEZN01009503.1/:142-1053(+)
MSFVLVSGKTSTATRRQSKLRSIVRTLCSKKRASPRRSSLSHCSTVTETQGGDDDGVPSLEDCALSSSLTSFVEELEDVGTSPFVSWSEIKRDSGCKMPNTDRGDRSEIAPAKELPHLNLEFVKQKNAQKSVQLDTLKQLVTLTHQPAVTSSPSLPYRLVSQNAAVIDFRPLLWTRRCMSKVNIRMEDGRITVVPAKPPISYVLHLNAPLTQFMFSAPQGDFVFCVEVSKFIGASVRFCQDLYLLTFVFSCLNVSHFSFPAADLDSVEKWCDALRWLQSSGPKRTVLNSSDQLDVVLEDQEYD